MLSVERCIIFANPIAGRGRGRAIAEQLANSLPAAFKSDLVLKKPSDVQASDLPASPTAAVCIGGDGSLRAVVEALLRIYSTPPPVLLFPMGTANLMARHLGIGWSRKNPTSQLIAALRNGRIVQVDAARANGQLFLLMVGVGFDAHVVHLLDKVRAGPIDLVSYLVPTARTLAEYRFPAITLSVDGRTIIEHRAAIAFIGNVKEYGIGFPILTKARSDDGLLDICVMPCRDHRDLAEMLMMVISGEHALREDVIYLRGKSVHVDAESPVPIQLDGDSAGHTPLQIEMLPTQISFLVPQL